MAMMMLLTMMMMTMYTIPGTLGDHSSLSLSFIFSFVAVNLFVIIITFVLSPLSSRVLFLMVLSFDFEDDGMAHSREVVCWLWVDDLVFTQRIIMWRWWWRSHYRFLSSSLSLLWWWLRRDGVSIDVLIDVFRLQHLFACSFVVLVLTFSFSFSLSWLLLFSSSKVGGGFNCDPSWIILLWRYLSNSGCLAHTFRFSSVKWYVCDNDIPQIHCAVPSLAMRIILSLCVCGGIVPSLDGEVDTVKSNLAMLISN